MSLFRSTYEFFKFEGYKLALSQPECLSKKKLAQTDNENILLERGREYSLIINTSLNSST